MTIRVQFPEIEIQEVSIDGRSLGKIGMQGTGRTTEPGKPELPIFSRLVAVPSGAAVHLSIQEREYTTVKGMRLLPFEDTDTEKKTNSPPTIDNDFYSRDAYYPERIIESGPPIQLRDHCLVPITLYPVQYNPRLGEMKVLRDVTIILNHDGNMIEKSTISEAFEKLHRSMAIDHTPLQSFQAIERGAYLIITPDHYVEALQPLVDWKRQKGHHTEVASLSQIGPDPDNNAIRDFILNHYLSAEVPLEYVILAGDADAIPTFFYYDEMEEPYSLLGPWDATDHPYSMLQGDDYFSDVLVGRLSVSSVNEMHTVVNKIVSYERNPYMGQTDWYTRALMICNYGGIASARTTKLWIREKLLNNGYTHVDTSFTFDMEACETEFISSVINSGVSLINYRGELDWGGWTSPDDYDNIYALNNGYMLPVISDMVCRSAAFYFDCPAEAWLRAGSVINPRGAVTVVGPTAINTKGYFNNALDGGFYAGIFDDDLYTVGQALARAKAELYTQYPLNRGSGHAHNSVECYFHIYTLIGDPGLEIWTAIPQAFSITAPSIIAPGTNQFTVWVNDTGQDPVDNAYVCLTAEGEILAGGFTGADGRVDLPLSLEAGDSATMTVTMHNFEPHQEIIRCEEIPVGVVLSDHTIDDDLTGQSQGDGDGIFNPGETVEVALSLRNAGSSGTAPSVSAEITCNDPYVTITDGTSPFGDIPPGQSAWGQDQYLLTLSPDCPDGHRFTMYLEITDNTNSTWNSSLDITVEAPKFSILSTQVDDGDQATPNTILDPGETAGFILTLVNEGSKSGTGIQATLMTEDPHISVTEPTTVFGTITAGSQADNAENPFILTAYQTTRIGHQTQFRLILESNPGMIDTVYTSLTVGTPSSSDPSGPDVYGYIAYDNTDGHYGDRPIYHWIEIDPALGGPGTVVDLTDEPAPPAGLPWGYVPYYPQGDTKVLPLPFTFRFYGESFDQISVCSNGWLSMSTTWMTSFRNWSLPSVLNPPGLIAPFWDDLYTGDGCVAYWYDENGHRFLVEWSGMRNDYNHALETFQVVLYDTQHYPTATGDGEILFQYQIIDNGDYTGNYATVGIESPDKQSALEYTYAGQYSPGAGELRNGLAIKFTTGADLPSGPFLSLYDLSVDDDHQGMSSGDGDGRVESGEMSELHISLQNSTAELATQIRGILTSGDEYITIIEDTSIFPDIAPHSRSTDQSNRFMFSVADETPYHLALFDLLIYTNEDEYNNAVSFEIEIGRQNILLIDDAGDDESGDHLANAAFFVNLSFEYYEKSTEAGLDTALFGDYATLLWFTGNRRDSTLTVSEQAWLVAFLDNGGNLLLTGQNIASDLRGSSFLQEYLHAQFVADNSEDTWLRGVSGDPLTGDLNLLAISDNPYGAGDQTSPDVIQPQQEASPILSYFSIGQCAALRYRGAYNLVYFAFGFEAIIDYSDPANSHMMRADLLNSIYNWFQFEPRIGDINEDGVINVLDIVGIVNIILDTGPDPTQYQLWASDFDSNGQVNILDVIGIVNIILGRSQATQEERKI